MSETRTLTLTITHIPVSKPGEHKADLIEWTHGVDAPLTARSVERAAEAWICVEALATGLGEASGSGPTIRLASLLAMFSACACPPPSLSTTELSDGEADAMTRVMGGGL